MQALAPGGALCAAIPHYEDRPGQRVMADAVANAIADKRALLVEAGTGVGKTLAYLLPAVSSGQRVVVSTGTKTLQDQLARQDVPLLRSFVATPFQAVVLKGVANYVCLRRWHSGEGASKPGAAPPLPLQTSSQAQANRGIHLLANWVAETATGDRAEVEWLTDTDELWANVTTTPDARVGARCPFYERCFVTQARRAAERANLIIVNHHLYFADLALRKSGGKRLLPAHDVVIFDEAHQLEDVATEHFSVRVGTQRIGQLVRDAAMTLGALPLWAQSEGQSIQAVERAAIALFGNLRAPLVAAGMRGERGLLPHGIFDGTHSADWFRLDAALEELAQRADDQSEGPDGENPAQAGARGSLTTIAKRARDIRDDLALIAEQRHREYVYWGEAKPNGTTLSASPLAVADIMRTHVLGGEATPIFTSATLSAGDNFAFARSRLGLTVDAVDAISVASPFDYEKQAILYAPRDLPLPTLDVTSPAALQRARELLEITDGHALILCTSLRAVSEFAATVDRKRYHVLVQGQAPRTALIEQFRATPRSVLIGAASFWEGVDIPGDSLRLVVIDRLPFAPHTDPLAQARSHADSAAGLDPFYDGALPAAAIAFRQGFGRLIRRRDDRGIVAVLDVRLATKGYGKAFVNALPPNLRRTAALEQVRRFWLTNEVPTG